MSTQVEKRKIKEFAEVTTGGTPSTIRPEFWEGGKIPWLRSGELKDCKIYNSEKFINDLGLRNSAARLMPAKTVLIALTGATTGQTGMLEFEASANQSVTGILPSSYHHAEYLFYYLRSIKRDVKSKTYGAAQPHISQEFVKNIIVPLPPLPIQRQIAAILEKADAALQKRRKANQFTEQFLQSAFLEMFGDPVTNPKGWETSTIEEISTLVTDGEHATPKRTMQGIKLLSARNIQNGYIDFAPGVDYIDQSEYERIKRRCNPLLGDVLLSCSGSVGRVTTVNITEPFTMVRSVALIKPNHKIVHSKYLEHYLRTEQGQYLIKRSSKASSQANIFIGPIKDLPVLVPPLENQQNFAALVEKVESLRVKQKKSELELETLFGSLMQKAFNGELVS